MKPAGKEHAPNNCAEGEHPYIFVLPRLVHNKYRFGVPAKYTQCFLVAINQFVKIYLSVLLVGRNYCFIEMIRVKWFIGGKKKLLHTYIVGEPFT